MVQERRKDLKKIFVFVCILLLLPSLFSCTSEEDKYIGTFKTSEWTGDIIYTFTFSEDHTGAYKAGFMLGETEVEQFSQPFHWRVKNGELFLTFEGQKEEPWLHALRDDTLIISIGGNMQTFYRTDENGKITQTIEPIE